MLASWRMSRNDLVRGLPVLLECDKDLVPWLFINLRGRLKQRELRTVFLDGRPSPEDQAGMGPPTFVGVMLSQLRAAVRGAVEKRVVVLPHLDLLTTSQGGLTAEAREVIPLLYENPELVWLGLQRSFVSFAERDRKSFSPPLQFAGHCPRPLKAFNHAEGSPQVWQRF